MEERLDRGLATSQWFDIFPEAQLINLVAPASDHYPILVNCLPVANSYHFQRSFRFENSWKLEPGFDDFLKETWCMFDDGSVVNKLDRCAAELSN